MSNYICSSHTQTHTYIHMIFMRTHAPGLLVCALIRILHGVSDLARYNKVAMKMAHGVLCEFDPLRIVRRFSRDLTFTAW